MTSNGFLLSEEIIRELSQHNVSSIQITLDGCREDHNKVRRAPKGIDSYQVILRNIRSLLSHQIHVSLRINYTIKNIHRVIEIKDELKDLDKESKSLLFINLQRVWQDKDMSPNFDLKSDMDKIIYGFKEIGINTYYYVDDKITYSCYADKNNEVLINFNGDIFKCTARDFKKENRYGYLNENGEIIWNKELLEERRNSRFKNHPCLQCRIAPICSGGCSQVLIENKDKDYCIYGYNERKKDEIILDNFENSFML